MKLFIFTFLLIISITTVIAQDSNQETSSKKFNFGIKHGYSSWDIKSEYDSYSDIHLSAGLFIEKPLSEKFGLRLEVNYSRREILEIPLLLSYKLSNKFELLGGVELDYAYGDYDRTNLQNKSTGISLVLGTQYNINSHWFVDVRYIHGLSNQFVIGNSVNNYSFGKRRSFGFGVGYKF